MLLTTLKVGPTREGAVRDVNRGAVFEARRLEVFAAQRWKRRRTGPVCKLTHFLVVLLPPAAIHPQ